MKVIEITHTTLDSLASLLGDDLHEYRAAIEEIVLGDFAEDPEFDQDNDISRKVLYAAAQQDFLRRRIDSLWLEFVDAQEQGNLHSIYDEENLESVYLIMDTWSQVPHRLVAQNLDLVKKAAIRFQKIGESESDVTFDDLESAAREALFLTAERAQVSNKVRLDFRNVAFGLMKKKINELRSRKHPVPFKVRQKLSRLTETREELGQTGITDSAANTIAGHLRLTKEDVLELMDVESVWGNASDFDSEQLPEALEVEDESPGPEEMMIMYESSVMMTKALTYLTDVQKVVVEKIYFKELSFRVIASQLNLSLPKVKKIHRVAVRKIRERMNEDTSPFFSDSTLD